MLLSRRSAFILLLVAWVIASASLLLLPATFNQWLPPQASDKTLHFALFFAGGVLFSLGKFPARYISLMVAWAVASELLQIFAVTRTPSTIDALFNLVGLFSGLGIGRALSPDPLQPNKRNTP